MLNKYEVSVIGIFEDFISLAVRAITNNVAILRIILEFSGFIIKKDTYFCHLQGNSVMIQRIQSLYLLIVILLAGLLTVWAPLWKVGEEELLAYGHPWIKYVFIAIAVLALYALLSFKDRKKQFILNRFNLFLNLILLGVFVFRALNLSGEAALSEKSIGMLIPIFSIVFLVLANKSIKKDEDLVKSVDRLR